MTNAKVVFMQIPISEMTILMEWVPQRQKLVYGRTDMHRNSAQDFLMSKFKDDKYFLLY